MTEKKSKLNLDELESEIQTGRALASQSVREFLATINLVSEVNLAQVLIALWDSGFYEYVRKHDRIDPRTCCQELGLNEMVFASLMDYLIGRGIFEPSPTGLTLTEKGRPYWNYVTRGVLTAHVAGYNQLLAHLGP